MRLRISNILVLMIKAYRLLISPMIGRNCRFSPSCSEYAVEAIEEYGAVKGLQLVFTRVTKCHPLHPGGFDPVPKDGTRPERLGS